MEQRLAEALQGRRCTQYTYATVHEDVPPELPADPAFTPSYPPYPYQRQAAALRLSGCKGSATGHPHISYR